jgi:TonB family protein
MSTYGNLMNSFSGPVLVARAPRIESLTSLSTSKPRWQAFAVSYLLEGAVLAVLLTITIAAPQIAPKIAKHVELMAPYLEPAPTLRAKPVHVVQVAPVMKPVLPVREPEPVAKVELPAPPPVVEAPRPQRMQKIAKVAEMEQPVPPAPTPKFDSKVLNALPGPKSPAKIVATNTFGGSSATPTLPKMTPSKVQTGGFGDPNGVPLNAHGSDHPNIASVGSFELPGGPGYGNGTGGARGARGTVASAGFGNGVAVQGGGGAGGNAAQGRVQSGGFATATAPAANPEEIRQRHAAATAAPSTTPVSIQSKPTPVYTAEARQMKIEGEVLLNVMFTADGHVQVLNVVRGLGHGLDEAAQRAAQGIRFAPAMREGHAVDSAAVLHIIFQLS